MKISSFVLFILFLSCIVFFTKLNLWLNIKVIYLFGLLLTFVILNFWEIHRENKKREYLVGEIRGNY